MASQNDEPGDFDRLARRYLDLWQSQLSGLAADQALTEQIARLFAAANSQVASALGAQGAQHGAPSAATAAAAAGTPAAAAASRDGPDDLGKLRKRVEALEARLAELEARFGSV